jgi:hypothetical protein
MRITIAETAMAGRQGRWSEAVITSDADLKRLDPAMELVAI